MYVFVYGTLMSGYGNNHYLDDARFVGAAFTDNMYMLTASGIPYVSESKPVSQIKGELYHISDKDESHVVEALDALEGHPDWYCRKEIDVWCRDERIKAWLYFNERSKGESLIESGNYRNYTK